MQLRNRVLARWQVWVGSALLLVAVGVLAVHLLRRIDLVQREQMMRERAVLRARLEEEKLELQRRIEGAKRSTPPPTPTFGPGDYPLDRPPLYPGLQGGAPAQ
jgi:hypothetical protein